MELDSEPRRIVIRVGKKIFKAESEIPQELSLAWKCWHKLNHKSTNSPTIISLPFSFIRIQQLRTLSLPRGAKSQPPVSPPEVPADVLLTLLSSFWITSERPRRLLTAAWNSLWGPDSGSPSWGDQSAGSETFQAQGCLMNTEHKARGAFVNGAREKIWVQSKAEHSILLLFNYIQLLSPLLVQRHPHIQTHKHTPHKEKRKSMPSIHNAALID